jgi:hypothetical protein
MLAFFVIFYTGLHWGAIDSIHSFVSPEGVKGQFLSLAPLAVLFFCHSWPARGGLGLWFFFLHTLLLAVTIGAVTGFFLLVQVWFPLALFVGLLGLRKHGPWGPIGLAPVVL